MQDRSFDPIWEEKYAAGHAQRYPWDVVVSFIFRHAPRDRPRGEVRILEVGCGTASNLWFAAREGFRAYGVEASVSAVATARKRLEAEGLDVDFHIGSFTDLPYEADHFDLVLDRCSLTCCGFTSAAKAIGEIHRVLKPGGKFLFNPYADTHASAASGKPGPDGLTVDITGGTLVGCGQLAFYSREQVQTVMGNGWNLMSFQSFGFRETLADSGQRHDEWRVVAEKAS